MKEQNKKKLIYVRYALPPILIALMLITMLIPAYKYVSAGEVNDTISAFSLIKNSYDQSRTVLFGTAEQSNANIVFSRILLTVIIASAVLFAIALASALYCAVVAFTYFISDDEKKSERIRTFFVTLIPNRTVASVLQALYLPLLLIPYAMPLLYKYIFNMRVVLTLRAPDPLILGGICLLAIFALTVICAPMEREFKADIFKRSKIEFGAEREDEKEDYTPIFTASDNERQERNERIRELLTKNKEN